MRMILALALSCFASSADAGWYDVENFEGVVGSKRVHLSIQRYDSFGSGITVEGSYYADTIKAPVPVYGKLIGSSLELCMISGEEQFEKVLVQGSKQLINTAACPVRLQVSDAGAVGSWRHGTNSSAVKLHKVAALNDKMNAAITGNLEIPFGLKPPIKCSWAFTRKQGPKFACRAYALSTRLQDKLTGNTLRNTAVRCRDRHDADIHERREARQRDDFSEFPGWPYGLHKELQV